MLDPVKDMNAIDGCIADLAAKSARPQGYPFSRISVYAVNNYIAAFMPEFEHKPASSLKSMRKLDFKKAGKVFGDAVKQMKDNLDSVPPEYIITSDKFDVVNETTRKTTACRKYMVEVETLDCEDQWLAICFKKAVRKYVTEDLALTITPCVFGDKYPELNPSVVVPRVRCVFVNGPETIYQALEKHGKEEFADQPIRLRLITRKELYDGVTFAGVKSSINGSDVVFQWEGMSND
jgi:hypothetical protein